MPAYTQQLASRFDASGVVDVARKDAIHDRFMKIVDASSHTSRTLEEVLTAFGKDEPDLVASLLVHTSEYDSFAIMTLERGRVSTSYPELIAGEEPLAEPDVAVDDAFEAWSEAEGERVARIASRLFPTQHELRGMDGVAALAIPSTDEPLTSGHEKAKLVALEPYKLRRAAQDLPVLLAAYAHPANVHSIELRKSLLRLMSYQDVPAVWDVVRAAIADPALRATAEYVSSNLDGFDAVEQPLYLPRGLCDAVESARGGASFSACLSSAWNRTRDIIAKLPRLTMVAEVAATNPSLAAALEHMNAYGTERVAVTCRFRAQQLADMKAVAARLDRSLGWCLELAWALTS